MVVRWFHVGCQTGVSRLVARTFASCSKVRVGSTFSPARAVPSIAQGRRGRSRPALPGFAPAPCASPSAPQPQPPAPQPPPTLTQQLPPTPAPLLLLHQRISPALHLLLGNTSTASLQFPPCAIFFPPALAAAAVAGTRWMLSGLHRWAAADTPHAGTPHTHSTHPHPGWAVQPCYN